MSSKGDERLANVQQKRTSEYPKYVEDAEGGRVRVNNEIQEDCVKKGKPFPASETSKKKEKQTGPQEYPKMVSTPEGHKRTVRSKEEEHAVKNGKKWVDPETEAEEGIVAKSPKGPQAYPKMVKVGDAMVKVRNPKEEAAALGEKIDENEDGSTEPNFEKMTKKKLEAYAKEHFGVDIDRRKKQPDLAAEVMELASKKDDGTSPKETDVEKLDAQGLVDLAKTDFNVELDVELGKEALLAEIDKLLDEDSEDDDFLGE